VTGKPQTNTKIKAVLFDLDDTLLNSVKARVNTLEKVFSKNGIPLDAHNFMFGLNGSPFREALKELERVYSVKDDLFNQYRRNYWFGSHLQSALYPGIKEMLNMLKSGGYQLGIVTSKMHDFLFEGRPIGCVIELDKVGIAGFFSAVIRLEDVQKPKPDPECIHLALGKIGIAPADALVVGDSAADIDAARAAGCLSCRAVWGITKSDVEPLVVPADYTANDPADILRFIAHHR
jgi:pyrophosphatase PpaX